ncbi:MAG: hypothetical protein FJW40_11535 [Acidobacteria bacterium]|nr:hypothetical protein [Acidobacteriota bacterium]
MLLAGVSRAIITPPLGMTMLGYAGRVGTATGVDMDLTATLLVLRDHSTTIAILNADLALVGGQLFLDSRAAIAAALETSPDHVLINYNHTHCGPALKTYFYDTDPALSAMRDRYERSFVETCGKLAVEAAGNLRRARVGTAAGEARIGINRREADADGSIFLGENPDGPVDHEVRVIRVDDLEGRPVAVAFAHGCHTVTMGPKCMAYSPDYPGPARRIIESHVGCPSLFLQANGGNVNPITGIGGNIDDSSNKNRLGGILGGEVVKLLGGIHTESERGPRVFFGMLSKAAMYPRVPLRNEPKPRIEAREVEIELPLYPFPSLPESRELERRYADELQRHIQQGTRGALLNVGHVFHRWARNLVATVESGRKPSVTGRIQALRIGDLAIASFPGETFAEAGMEVKRRSSFPHTAFLGYSNGAVSYVPTREAYPADGWSVNGRYGIPDMHFKDYGLPTALLPGCSEAIVERSVSLLAEMWSS